MRRKTLGMTVCWAQSVPNFSTNFFRLLVAASLGAGCEGRWSTRRRREGVEEEEERGRSRVLHLMANTWSMSQVMHREFSFSSKKSTPSWRGGG